MNPTRLRRWIRRYGNAGVVAAGCCLGWRYVWTKRRPALVGAIAAFALSALLWSFGPHRQARKQAPVPPASVPIPSTPWIHSPERPKLLLSPRNLHVLLSREDPRLDYYRVIGAASGRKIVWTDGCSYGNARVAPDKRIVCYVDVHGDLIARNFTGDILWQTDDLDSASAPVESCAGGSVLFLESVGVCWGVGTEDIACWEGEDGFIGSQTVTAWNARNGEKLWDASEADVGFPVWTDGDVLLDVRWDVSAHAVQKVIHVGGHLPIWIELRRVRDRRCLWTQRLRGLPPGLTRITRVGRNRDACLFAVQSHPTRHALQSPSLRSG